MFPLKKTAPAWEPSPAEFNQFLVRLDPDRDQAGQAYEDLRLRLFHYFERRRCHNAEDWVDQTLNRLIEKVCRGDEEIQDPTAYALGIARFLYLEYQRVPASISLADWRPEDDWHAAQKSGSARTEQEQEAARQTCMLQCLAKLPPDEQRLMVEYYQDSGRTQSERRRQMAAARGVTYNALCIQVHRIREKLEVCLTRCLKRV